MHNFEIIIIVFTVLVALLAIADKLGLPNPVLLVLAGLSIGFIPSMPALALNPEVVFLIFLPPILYDAASHTSWHDFRAEIKPISTLAIALVIFTTVAVASASYWLIPGFTWPLAFVLGAIVSPPDAVAATSIIKGLGLNKRVITILEGESLVNDASALIAYRFAIAAIGTGSFIFWKAGLDFVVEVTGGIFAGVAIGYGLIHIHKRILNNSIISTSLTMLTPFISYLTAEHFNTSGVLAVVSTGLMVSWRASQVFSYQTRIRSRAVWDTIIFLLNGFIFILIGLQLPSILDDLQKYSIRELLIYGLVVSSVTIAIRILWVFAAAYSFIVRTNRRSLHKADGNTWKNVLIVAWTGTRGVVSLATALALPLTVSTGATFPQRSLILFLAFVVIIVTLVIQGLSLPLLIRLLDVKPHREAGDEERDLRLYIANSVIGFVERELPFGINDQLRTQIKRRYVETIDLLSKERNEYDAVSSAKPVSSPLLMAQSAINKFQRELLVTCHKNGTFSQSAVRRLEQELDLEELQLNRLLRKKK